MLSRPSRAILRNIPSSSQATLLPTAGIQKRFRSTGSSDKAKTFTTSVSQSTVSPAFVEYSARGGKGITPEAKQRVQEHVRRIQSSASASAPAAAVRAQPAPHFQAPPNQNTPDSPLAAPQNANIRDGYDHS